MQGECNGKTGKLCFTGLDTAEPKLSLCKDNANECSESLLLHCRVQLILCKGRMNIHAKFVVSYKILVVYLQSCDTQTQTIHSYTTMCA